MSNQTHYETLGLSQSAPPEVIRAAYKAHCLLSHPDKTLGLAPQDRAAHAAFFNEIQAAYDVLGTPSLKAAYDAELKHHNNLVDTRRSTFHRSPSSQSSYSSSTSSKAKSPVKLTTPEEKAALRARARQSIEELRAKRANRDLEEEHADVDTLKHLVQIWTDIAEENKLDPAMLAHCTIRIHEYNQKIAERARQHEEWLEKIATAKRPQSTTATKEPVQRANSRTHVSATPSDRTARVSSRNTTPTPTTRSTRTEMRKQAEADKAAAAAARAEAREAEKLQREAAKQAHLEQKAAAVRAEKAKQQARVEQQAQKDAQRIAKARAKAGAAPLNTVGAAVGGGDAPSDAVSDPAAADSVQDGDSVRSTKPAGKICDMCGLHHQTFREWHRCNSASPHTEVHQGA